MIGKIIISLGQAIGEYEGWNPDNLATAEKLEASVAFRNNNPGNLRSSVFAIGVKDGFAYFYNEEIGWQALYYDLWIKASGKSSTGIKADSTLGELMHVFAPKCENDTEAYLQFIERKTGFQRSIKLAELIKA
jgi:hypothetical protein